jgi:hypothetical protein
MRAMSMFSFVGAMVLLGIGLLWFKPVADIFNDTIVPLIGMPDYMVLFLKLLPFIVASMILLTSVMRLMKGGKRDDFYET